KPEGFITSDEIRSIQALNATKELYDLGKKEERNNPILKQDNETIIRSNPFNKLIIDLDNDQIWTEINLQNKPFLNYVTSQLIDDELSQMDIDEHNLDVDERKNDDESDDEEIKENSNETDDEKERHPELDDKFFDLSEFNKTTEENENFEDFDDEIDYFADIKYSEFFDPPKKKEKFRKKSSSKLDEQSNKKKGVVDLLEESENDDDFLNNKVRNLFARDDNDDDDEQKSSFQKRQERIKHQIEQFETENVAEKDWTLVGEASSKDRPINSLLEENLEFDHIVKPVPVITEQFTEKLEDIIKRRILDETFDDVERKRDPNFRPFLPSKLIEISDEKSKKSLAEIYEEDYVNQTNALSNFHYTPKPPKPEITIISDLPAISMEEVIPVNVSDAKLLAPEEVYDKKKGEIKGETEKDSNEKKRAHVAKKRAKKKEKLLKEREKKVIEK
ncbi:11050_t:CDS:10, partial [Funneliformis geosporum]